MIRLIELGNSTPQPYRREVHELLYKFDKEKKKMPLTTVSLETLPQPSQRGQVIPEIQEVMNALTKLPKTSALAVTLTKETALRLSKSPEGKPARNPLRGLASSLKRHFKANGLGFTAFHNDSKSCVFVKHEDATPAPAKKK